MVITIQKFINKMQLLKNITTYFMLFFLLNPESVTIPPAPSTAPINIPRCLPTAPPIDANDAQSQ